jgi:uncharacterized membrane protein required for colicin V production
MHWLDTTFLVLLAAGAGLGFCSGLLWQVARVLNLGIALFATFALHEPTVELLQEHALRHADPSVLNGTAYLVVFLACYLLLLLLAHLLQRMLQASGFSWLDRFLGAGLGAVKTAAVLAGICLLLSRLPNPLVQESLSRSALAPTLSHGMESALALIPDDFKRDFIDGVGRLKISTEQ